MSLSATFRREIESFIAKNDIPPTRFGMMALNDREFVRRIRRDGNVTLKTYDRVQDFMRDYDKYKSLPARMRGSKRNA